MEGWGANREKVGRKETDETVTDNAHHGVSLVSNVIMWQHHAGPQEVAYDTNVSSSQQLSKLAIIHHER